MKRLFSNKWNASRRVSKQRKFRFNAALHTKQKFTSCHLSKTLREKHKRRSVNLRVGDKVKILRGQYKGRENKVEKVDLKKERIYVTGIDHFKKDGAKFMIPLKVSNLMITELNLDDKKRKQKLEVKNA